MHIIGAGGHAKVVADIILESGIPLSGVWDENPELKSFLGYPVNGNFSAFKQMDANQAIVAVGDNLTRKKLACQLVNNNANLIHPHSIISRFAKIGIGTVVMANVVVNVDTLIGNYVILNTNSSVDHDCLIGDFVHISPKVGIAGNVEIGEGAHIGVGANIIQGIKIGKWAVIGAGTVIIRDVPDYAVVVGNPGRIIRYNKFDTGNE